LREPVAPLAAAPLRASAPLAAAPRRPLPRVRDPRRAWVRVWAAKKAAPAGPARLARPPLPPSSYPPQAATAACFRVDASANAPASAAAAACFGAANSVHSPVVGNLALAQENSHFKKICIRPAP
jgi:hypothetical protein